MKNLLICTGLVLLASTSFAEWVVNPAEGWSLTVGGSFGFSNKSKLKVRQLSTPPQVGTTGNRNAAKTAGDAIALTEGRTDFGNGAFYDANDAAGTTGSSWNWRVPAGVLDANRRMRLAQPFTEQTTIAENSIAGSAGRTIHDDENLYGTHFGLNRALWRDGRFGVEFGVGFGFSIRDNFLKGHTRGWSATTTKTSGNYLTDVQFNSEVFDDPWSQNADGSWGAGSFDGPGPVLDSNEIGISHSWDEDMVSTSTIKGGGFSVRGDLQIYEFQFSLKPYYELTDWFRVQATLGLGIDYRDFDVKVSGIGSQRTHDWDPYLLCGLGCQFAWHDVTLGIDVLRKVFDEDIEVNGRYVNGEISNSDWYLCLALGYSF